MWLLAVGSVITVGQRMWSISRSPGARDLIPLAPSAPDVDTDAETDVGAGTDTDTETQAGPDAGTGTR